MNAPFFSKSGSGIPPAYKLAVIGDSNTYRSYANTGTAATQLVNSPLTWARYLLGGSIKFDYDTFNGVSGRTYLSGITEGGLDAVCNSDASMVFVNLGVNDINGTRTLANIKSDIDKYVLAITSKNKYAIFVTIHPTTTGVSGPTAAGRVNGYQLNRYLKQVAALNPLVFVADPVPYLVDPASATGAPLAGMMSNEVHFNAVGSYWSGLAISDVIRSIVAIRKRGNVGYTSEDFYDVVNNPDGNFLDNPTWQGSGGTFTGGWGFSGTAPTGWTFLGIGTTGTQTCTVSTTAIAGQPGLWLKMQIAGTPGGSGVYYHQIVKTLTIPIGKKFSGRVKVAYDSGHSNFLGAELKVLDNSAGVTAADGTTTPGEVMPNITIAGLPYETTPIVKSVATVAQFLVRIAVPAGLASSANVYLQAPYIGSDV